MPQRSEDNLYQYLVLSYHLVGPEDQVQVVIHKKKYISLPVESSHQPSSPETEYIYMYLNI